MPSSRVGPLLVHVDVGAELEAPVRYAFESLGADWGVPIEMTFGSIGDGVATVDVLYAPPVTRPDGFRGAFLAFDARSYDPERQGRCDSGDGRPLWLVQPPGGPPDLVGSWFRLVALLDESQVAEADRNRLGIFNTPALPSPRARGAGLALADHAADRLWNLIAPARPDLSRQPLWPGGCTMAVAVSHDTDAVHLGAPGELVVNSAKALLRLDTHKLRDVRDGLRSFGHVTANPLYGFPVWAAHERERDIRSCFYLATRPRGVTRDRHDCRSTVTNQRVDWVALRELADDGWEFGLHAAICAESSVESIRSSVEALEAHLDRPILGVRHHYVAIDWRRPDLTFNRYRQADLRYDTSMMWRDRPGFRAATSRPYRPWDPVAGTSVDLWELPTAIMDVHLVGRSESPGVVEAQRDEVVAEVQECGGLLMFDWHTEYAGRGYRQVDYPALLDEVMMKFLDRSDVWIATPIEIARHCEQRARALRNR